MLDGWTWDTSVVNNFETTKLLRKTQNRREAWWNPAFPFGPCVLFFLTFANCVGWRNPGKQRVVLWIWALLSYTQGVIMLTDDDNSLSYPNFWKCKPWAFWVLCFPFCFLDVGLNLSHKFHTNAHIYEFLQVVFWNNFISWSVFLLSFVNSWRNLKNSNKEKRRPEPRCPLSQVEKEMLPGARMIPVQAAEQKEMCLRKESLSSSKAGLRFGFPTSPYSCVLLLGSL